MRYHGRASHALFVLFGAVFSLAACSTESSSAPTAPTVAAGDAQQTMRSTTEAPPSGVASWPTRVVDPSPLSARSHPFVAWTGSEMLVVGGTNEPCPPNSDCVGVEQLNDGAAYDPALDTWRPISTPGLTLYGTGVLIDGTVYAQGARGGLYSYLPGTDTWAMVDLPDPMLAAPYAPLVATDTTTTAWL